jgi:hypothetical protein
MVYLSSYSVEVIYTCGPVTKGESQAKSRSGVNEGASVQLGG